MQNDGAVEPPGPDLKPETQRSPGFRLPAGAQQTTMTVAPEQAGHYISDDQLTRICEMREEPVGGIFLGAAGALAGVASAAYQSASIALYRPEKIAGNDLINMAIAILALSIAAVTGFLWQGRRRRMPDIAREIRDRLRRR